jgi:hypothetical protein
VLPGDPAVCETRAWAACVRIGDDPPGGASAEPMAFATETPGVRVRSLIPCRVTFAYHRGQYALNSGLHTPRINNLRLFVPRGVLGSSSRPGGLQVSDGRLNERSEYFGDTYLEQGSSS